jgi:hypothetical protein
MERQVACYVMNLKASQLDPLGLKGHHRDVDARRWGLVHEWRPLEGDESLRQKLSFLEISNMGPFSAAKTHVRNPKGC